MKQTSIKWGGIEMATIINLCETLREVGPPAGLEWAGMVLAHWYEKHYGRIYNARPPYRFRIKDYQALALRELLLSVGFQHVLDDVIRNGIVGQLDQHLPKTTISVNPQKLLL